MVQEVIQAEVAESQFFSVMCDETTDVSTKNQISTVLRFVSNGEVRERFIGFDNVSALSGTVESANRYIVII